MTNIRKIAAAAAVATLAFAASDLAASAQSAPAGDQGASQGQPTYRRPVRTVRSADASRRPLTVRRTVAAAEAPVVTVAPVPVENTGPGTLVTGPLGFASNVISLPFRAINGIFPATGDVGANPLVIIGAPLHAIGDIVQVPLRVVGAPFGGTTIATY